ncbi:TPA: transcriptional repressor LexA [Clostridioides difficile]
MRTKSPKRMKEIIDFVNEYTNHYRTSPSTREIAKVVKTDNGTVYRYLVEMDEKGMLEYNGKEIITPTIKKMENDMIQAAVLGSVSCGIPLLEEEHIESYISLPAKFFDKGEYFILRANGDSMIEAGIEDGDLVVIKKQEEANEGQIVVALLEDGSTTLKRLYLDRGNKCVRLQSENKNMSDIITANCSIQGVAIKIMKDLI